MLDTLLGGEFAQAGTRARRFDGCVVSAVLMTGTFASSTPLTGLVTGRDRRADPGAVDIAAVRAEQRDP